MRSEPHVRARSRKAASLPKVSVVVPVYNEEDNVLPMRDALNAALGGLGRDYEIVFVDDGSRDQTPQRLQQAFADDPDHVRVVRFRRNFGQTAGIQAGIELSRGEVVVFMDGDLQNDPADIGMLLEKLDEGYDVVSGWRRNRQDDAVRRIPSRVANALISWVTGVHLHDYGCTLKAYRRDVLDHVKLYGEMHRFIPAVASWAGADIVEVPVRHHARRFGSSKYGISRTLRVLLDLLTVKMLGSYSTKPIYFFGFVGLALEAVAVLAGVEVIVEKLLPPHTYAHNNPMLLLAALLSIVGVQFILMGLLAEILMRTYHESQGKPIYVIRQILQSEPDGGGEA